LLWAIGLLNLMPILAPVLAKLNWYWPAKIIYFVYSFFCHQLDWRSLHVFGFQYGWCARCTFIWLNVLLSGIFVKLFKVKRIKWYWVMVLILPVALDGIIQTVATILGFTSFNGIYYMSNDLVRMITGTMFGLGFGLWIWTNLEDAAELPAEKKVSAKKPLATWKIILIASAISFLFYVVAVFVWDRTSPNNRPENWLDFGVKIPVNQQDFLLRSKNTL
jgi:uncharacterized membrane protein